VLWKSLICLHIKEASDAHIRVALSFSVHVGPQNIGFKTELNERHKENTPFLIGTFCIWLRGLLALVQKNTD
jgi:hypothetical protein